MKRVVSVSLNTSKRDKTTEVEILGEQFEIKRIGTDGDVSRYAQLLRELDGNVDAIGLGGIDMYLYAGRRRYTIRDARRLANNAITTPVVDGSGLKNTLERRTIERLQADGVVDFRTANTLIVASVDRFGLAEAIARFGGPVVFGDLMFAIGVPIPMRSLATVRIAAAMFLPIVGRLPFKWIYPTGEKSERIVPKFGKHYRRADVIAGDFLMIRRHLPTPESGALKGKVIITNTTTEDDVQQLRARGVEMLITTTPEYGGRSFGTNVMEGVLVSLSGKRPEDLSASDYEDLLARLDWQPAIRRLQESG